MLASAACLSTWSTETFLLKDYKLPVPEDHSDFELGTLSPSVVHVDQNSSSSIDSAGTSCGTSAASSECSVDDLYHDAEEDHFLGASISDLHESNDIIDVLSGLNWTSSDDLMSILTAADLSAATSTTSTTCPSPPQSPLPSSHSHAESSSPSQSTSHHTCNSVPQVSRKTHTKKSLHNRKWCSLSSSERLSLVEELSTTISCEMGLREQIEIIKIINPSANVSAADTEFAIDLDSLNDEKLERIRELVRVHSQTQPETLERGKANHSPHKKHTKRSKQGEKRSSPKHPGSRQSKEYRQLMKERRSGLFVREQILAVTSTPVVEEDIDVDIIG